MCEVGQRGEAAVAADNVFYPLTYEGAVGEAVAVARLIRRFPAPSPPRPAPSPPRPVPSHN